jgi:predicted Zn-dependent protease
MALMRKGIDPGHLRKRWLKLAWDAIDVMPKEQTAEKLPLMKDLAFRYQDLTTGLKALDHLKEDADEDNEEVGNQYHPLYLSAAGRWQDAATLWLKRVEANPTRADYHAHVAACLRRAGKNAEASEHDAMAEKLALADPLAGLLIGQAYSYGGDSQRASQWWQRVIMESSPENELWIKAVIRYANERTLAADWKHAAAAHEVLACDSYETGIDTISIRIRLRMNADFTRALNHLKTDRENSIKLLEKCHGLLVADGSLADYFFPALRKAGLMEQHATWFERSWHQLDSIIKTFPAGENSRNTAAWMASRAGLRLEEAEVQVDKALESAPEQAAYLDTKAEIAFARKDRKRALELSRLSLGSDPLDETLRQQFERYRSSPFLLP